MPNYEGREELRALCEKGIAWRYAASPAGLRERLQHELRIITKLGFTDYFLVVHDIVRLSRKRGVPVAGRGSGASSLVAYLLGITNVCPLTFGIPFERFLHEQREDPPDLDIDFCWRIRDDIINEVFRRYGEHRVAMVSTHIHLQRRSAFRETAKAHGLSDVQISKFQRSGRFPGHPEFLDRIRADAESITGFPRHLSVHPGGIVIVPDRIDHHVPTEPAEKGVIVTQYDKDGVEEAGLIKIDLLGNHALSTIHEAVRILGNGLDVERLPDNDPATIRVLRSGGTLGCNQLESPAMRSLLRMMRPNSTHDVMKALALIRPGAANLGMKERFIRRARGLEPPGPLLPDTYGVMIYEDDVMLVASRLAGLTLPQADRFRRRIGKRSSDEELAALSRAFLARCNDRATAADYWTQMAKFNQYSFCRAHAASYAVLAWASAFLKAHHPLAHWVAAINNNQGLYERRVYVEQAKREGIPIRLPCVNRSEADFTAEDGAIRVGLGQLHGISEREIESILTQRPFADLGDFLSRVDIRKPAAKNLILCGAFDFTGLSRPSLVLQLHAPGKPAPPIPDFIEQQKFEYEFDLLNLSARKHILSYLHRGYRDDVRSIDLPKLLGKRVRITGILATLRIHSTRNSEPMEFLTLEDEKGIFEVTVFPNVLRRAGRRVGSLGPYTVEGKVESNYDALTLSASRLTVREN
jgi:DNA polymerase-3 subunit alpha/error-prone DNA polymerase